MRIITVQFLNANYACPSEVALFHKMFGDSAVVTEETLARAAAAGLTLTWLVDSVLSVAARTKYSRKMCALRKEYDNLLCQAIGEFERTVAPARTEYERAGETTFEKYKQAHDKALKEYLRTKEAGWAKYVQTRDAFLYELLLNFDNWKD